MPRKPTLSPTRIATYLDCAMKYRYIYHDKIGRFYLRARPGYSFGSTLHQVLQAFHEEARATGQAQSVEKMVEQVDEKWIGAGYASREQEAEYRAASDGILHAYHADASRRIAGEVQTLFTEKTITTDMGPFRLQGRVDRVDLFPDGTLEIIDYKSGRMETSAEEVAESLAMSIYQLIMRRNHPGQRVIATLYALRGGMSASYSMTDKEAIRFEQDMLMLGEEILARDFDAVEPVPVPACEGCEFIAKCRAFWRSQRRLD